MRHPAQVRRLVLVGTTARGGEMADRDPDVTSVAGRPELTIEDYLFLLFERSATSRAAGREGPMTGVWVDDQLSLRDPLNEPVAWVSSAAPLHVSYSNRGQFFGITSSGARGDQHTLRRARTPSEAAPEVRACWYRTEPLRPRNELQHGERFAATKQSAIFVNQPGDTFRASRAGRSLG
jgi:hypothetical protein